MNERIYPIGRLDYDSSGLLLLTNDGDVYNKIIHPRVNLNKEYKDKKIFKNLNLEINKGEIIGLLAPNAEGKSTLLKILGGQITFDSGEYFFNGEEFTYKNKEVKNRNA